MHKRAQPHLPRAVTLFGLLARFQFWILGIGGLQSETLVGILPGYLLIPHVKLLRISIDTKQVTRFAFADKPPLPSDGSHRVKAGFGWRTVPGKPRRGLGTSRRGW